MKKDGLTASIRVSNSVAFLMGAAVTFTCFMLWMATSNTRTGKECDRLVDITLGRGIIDSIPSLDRAVQLGASNQLIQEQRVLRDYTWWQMEEAWAINKKYDGALDARLNPVLLKVYPGLRRQVDLSKFSQWPRRVLVEMTNFVLETDVLVSSNSKGAKP